ncbi:ketosynthase [Aquisalimonas lutea]|uniref:ketosynthase n=1 Tax=Aquisalimonas lutea TaxID=1327750 RepID=UPI0025B35854|nr:ketosynthase [Aquisalimonas lutea]MDN3517125.1 ketosynthase [Aquisalimonas lutea]
MARALAAIPWTVLFLGCYAATVHLGVLGDYPQAGLIALAALAVWLLRPGLRVRHPGAWLALAVVAAVTAAGLGTGRALAVLYLPPVLVTLMLLLVFAASLLPGRTPLITAVALQMGETDTPAVRRYTRRVTWGWSLLFAVLAAQNTALALWASPAVWSLFANILNYVIVAAAFLVEFRLRHRFLPGHRYPSFTGFVRGLAAHGGPWRGKRPS